MVNNKKGFQGCCPLTPIPKPPKQRCVCPPGPRGQRGPQGEPGIGITPAFGSLYQDPNLERVFIGPIDFDIDGPSKGTTPDPVTDTITVLKSGVYEITFDLVIIYRSVSNITLAVQENETTTIPETIIRYTQLIESETEIIRRDVIGKTIQVSLEAGDRLRVLALDVDAFSAYSNASFTVHLIN
ncbi:hypothetical protein [Bacillus sp. NTK034]|uniref:hypothetical protein n=1 Tax=Bacillus sp. NTK034 TaxID=2802176 RepID=UPI001A8FC8E7|nr:hypothetical protein [Bacillus sp. NTK034]MBN8203171.1 hypothetical protein [Bacillus sp. NTK034]